MGRYDYKPLNGKGDHLRKGADLQAYREGYDRIFNQSKKETSCESSQTSKPTVSSTS